jgi:hypothetical protein
MRLSSRYRQEERLTFGNLIYKIANCVVPADREEDIVGDDMEASWPHRAYEFACSGLVLRKTQIRRALIPPLTIKCNLPDRAEKHRRMNSVFNALQRAMRMYAFTWLGLIILNTLLLPNDGVLQFTFIVGPTICMIFLIRLHREGIGTKFSSEAPLSVTDEMEIEELILKRNLLSGGDFSPSRFALLSVLEAFVFMMVFFGPVYAIVRWFNGEPLPIYTAWPDLVWRFTIGVMLVFLWACIRKSNKLAAAIFQEEIDALNAERVKPVTA